MTMTMLTTVERGVLAAVAALLTFVAFRGLPSVPVLIFGTASLVLYLAARLLDMERRRIELARHDPLWEYLCAPKDDG